MLVHNFINLILLNFIPCSFVFQLAYANVHCSKTCIIQNLSYQFIHNRDLCFCVTKSCNKTLLLLRYEMSKGNWELSKPMNTVRSRVGVAVVGGKLYSIGGFDGAARLATVECYNPVLDEWTTVSPMTTKRSALAVAAVGEDLYVIGGYDGIASLCSVEMYAFFFVDLFLYQSFFQTFDYPCSYHTRTDTWRHGVPMHARRSASGVAVLQNSIYVVGEQLFIQTVCLTIPLAPS